MNRNEQNKINQNQSRNIQHILILTTIINHTNNVDIWDLQPRNKKNKA
jgi:hypothetical protein